jgi:hypothetical protein
VVACHPEEEWSSGSCPNLWEWDFDRGRRTVTSPLKFFAAGQACRTNSPHPPHPPSVRQREPTPARRNLAPGEIMGCRQSNLLHGAPRIIEKSFATPWQPRCDRDRQPTAGRWSDRTQRHLVVRRPGRWVLGKAVYHPGVVDRLCSRYWTREGGWVKMARPPVLSRNASPSLPIFHPTSSTLRHWGQQTSKDLRLSS